MKLKPTKIENCSFIGVQWDAKAGEAVQTLVDAALENAKAISALASFLKAQNITINTLLKV